MKISKEKRLQLVLVGILTLAVIAGLWFGLISLQQNKIHSIEAQRQNTQKEIDKVQKVVVEADGVAEGLSSATNRLNAIEDGMPSASGDLFSWIVSALKQFNVPSYKVDMPQISSPISGDVRMFPTFPYKQAVVTVSGSAYYYDFGKFVADFENHFPYMRIQNLSLEPGMGSTAEEREKLSFHMEIVTLIKPVGH